ncbi:MAG: protein-L-isoaspartate(D-aspartate) O-methyltransferase [Deltaproteobacteria bacterium]|nr:protein-L-isoaspartate(D-aspartate) O-methyltransferase [Deltaproteobacteria bacterium]
MKRDSGRYRRDSMIRSLKGKGIRDARVLAAMQRIPRHIFVPGTLKSQAYSEHALPIGAEQTISQPYIVARTTEWLQVGSQDSVLEIGTGSGYHTSVLALLARRVFSLERIPELARGAIDRIREMGFDNVKIQIFDGTFGWSDVGPFDRILVTAGAPKTPKPLLDQLKVGGRLVLPEGDRDRQKLILYERTPEALIRTEGESVAFVPLIGRHGW